MIEQGNHGKKLLKICKFIIDSPDPNETEVMRGCGLTRGQHTHFMQAIAESLGQFAAMDGGKAYLGQAHAFAVSLISAKDYTEATEVLQAAIVQAEAREEFDFILSFWDLASDIHPTPAIEGTTEERAALLKENLASYERLQRNYSRVRTIPGAEDRRQAMTDLLKHPLLSGPKATPLSHRATYYYLKVRSAILVHLRQYARAAELQAALVALLDTHPWLSDVEGLYLIQQLGHLANSYYRVGDLDQQRLCLERIHSLSSSNPRVELERITALYPVCIAIGIEQGNKADTVSAVERFFNILEKSSALLEKEFASRVLYFCFVGAIASASSDLRRRTLRYLSSYRKSDFNLRYFTMYRMLEVINAIEEEEYEEARRFITTRLRNTDDSVIPKSTEVYRFLSILITKIEGDELRKNDILSSELRDLLSALLHGTLLSEYFDIEVWVASKERGCSMLDIFRDRASSEPMLP